MSDIDHPSHYGGDTQFEAIKVIDDWALAGGFTLGSALKYICRAKHKGSEESDLRKALWYLQYAAKGGYLPPEPNRLDPDAIAHAWGLEPELQHVLVLLSQGLIKAAYEEHASYVVKRFGSG